MNLRIHIRIKKKTIKKGRPEKIQTPLLQVKNLWAHLGLNQGPPDYESGALTS